MDVTQILSLLCTAYGGSGSESGAASRITGIFSKNKFAFDTMGNLAVELCPPKSGAPIVMLEAHADEIGFIVQEVCPDGRLRLAPVGGVDHRTLYGSRVVFVTKRGPVDGTVCSGATEINEKEILADIGFPADVGPVLPGDRGYIQAVYHELNETTVCCKSLDNRVGCAVLIKAAEAIRTDINCGVYAVFTVQEEIGLRGAAAGALGIHPDTAVCVDVSFADAPGISEHKTGKFNGGPMIGVSPVLNEKVTDTLLYTAKRIGIPFQTEIMSDSTGTDADVISCTGGGIATGLVSVPLRNMHTANEIVSADDMLNSARLLAAYVNEIGGRGDV